MKKPVVRYLAFLFCLFVWFSTTAQDRVSEYRKLWRAVESYHDAKDSAWKCVWCAYAIERSPDGGIVWLDLVCAVGIYWQQVMIEAMIRVRETLIQNDETQHG